MLGPFGKGADVYWLWKAQRRAEGGRRLRARPRRERARTRGTTCPGSSTSCERGNDVIYPRYETAPAGGPALAPLADRDPRRARAARPPARAASVVVGYSRGGRLAVELAAVMWRIGVRPAARDERLPEHAEPERRGGRQLQPSAPLDPAAARRGRRRLAGRASTSCSGASSARASRPEHVRTAVIRSQRLVPRRPLLGAPVGPRGPAPVLGAARPPDRLRPLDGSTGSPAAARPRSRPRRRWPRGSRAPGAARRRGWTSSRAGRSGSRACRAGSSSSRQRTTESGWWTAPGITPPCSSCSSAERVSTSRAPSCQAA